MLWHTEAMPVPVTTRRDRARSGWPYYDDEAEIPLLASLEDYLAIDC